MDEAQAVLGLGALFASIRMSVDVKTFGAIAAAIPDVGRWMHEAPIRGARTGELIGLARPATLERKLAAAGFTEEQIAALGMLAANALREMVSEEVREQVAQKIPILADD